MTGCECPGDLPCQCEHAPAHHAAGHSPLLEQAARVLRERLGQYGSPVDHHAATAQAWTALLRRKLAPGAQLDANDVQRLFIADKLVRDTHTPIDDNPVDIVGYAVCLSECRQEAAGGK